MSSPTNSEELEMQGWTRRFTIEERRAAEFVKNYESLSYEVLVIPARSIDFDDKCDECIRSDTCQLVTIFTRSRKTS